MLSKRRKVFESREAYASFTTSHEADLISKATNFADQRIFDLAIEYCKKIPEWHRHKRVLSILAACYNAIQHSNLSELELAQAINNNIVTLQLLKALLNNDHETAINDYMRIHNWEQNSQALSGIAHCQLKLKRYDEALITIKTMPQWENDPQAILLMALYCHANKDSTATQLVERIIPYEIESIKERGNYVRQLGVKTVIAPLQEYCLFAVRNNNQLLSLINTTLPLDLIARVNRKG